jgi:hypothetical protein
MTRQTEPRAGSTPAELADRRQRFRNTIEQIHAHQSAAVLRTVAAHPAAQRDGSLHAVSERSR